VGVEHLEYLIPVLILGVPGVVLTFRAPVFGVSYGPAGVKYSGLLGAHSYVWADIRKVRVAVLEGKVHSSDVPEASSAPASFLRLGHHPTRHHTPTHGPRTRPR
ncbi:hypothetical protein PUR49_01240, partial [Streptomyces sp. BE147]|uniref:hypothetical protein n=1 Tax=Streptomyces sp. BE147 TaxID=3002524 RepID=UPI002E7800B8